jgi:phenylalanyl-tRNA synthetase alpha chain
MSDPEIGMRAIDEPRVMWDDYSKAISDAHTKEELEQLRWFLFGHNGRVTQVLRSIGTLPKELRRERGAGWNELKIRLEAAVEARRAQLEGERLADIAETEAIDITFPGPPLGRGHVHVLTQVQRQIETVLESLGYKVELGPEVETEWYNFEALNISAGHPARENWDSFYFTPQLLLRAHTSPVQIRAMQRLKEPPIYIITPGRCYRRDAPEATRLPYFSQVEGLAVDRGLTVGDMKGTLLYMIQSLYGKERKVRVRPSYFPFTEPSFEFDVNCGICNGSGCKSCRHKGWLEVGGCGMVHPQVLRNGGIDPEQWNGYAWGFGIERMAMLKHDVDDIRLFYESDLRFLDQF